MRQTDDNPATWSATTTADEDPSKIVRKIIARLLPFMILLYFVNSVDRVNISYAALTMNKDLGFTPEMYGFGAGIFFVGYFLFEVPSNLIMHRVGARLWMFRIMLTWGLISMAMAWVHTPFSFYMLRFLLGLAEAGFVPGMFLYLSYWVPKAYAGRANGLFILAIPLTTVLAGPLSVMLLELNGWLGLAGWQWMFVVEGAPAIILAFVTLWVLPDRPAQVSWLTQREKDWLDGQLRSEQGEIGGRHTVLQGLASPLVLLMSGIYISLVIGIYGVAFWLPQIVKGIGFTNQQTGFVIAGPYLLGTIACVFWPRRSDRMQERRWHFALPCFLASVSLMASAVIGPHPPGAHSDLPCRHGNLGGCPGLLEHPGAAHDRPCRGGRVRDDQLRRQLGRLRGPIPGRLVPRVERQLHRGPRATGLRPAAGRAVGAAAPRGRRGTERVRGINAGRHGLTRMPAANGTGQALL